MSFRIPSLDEARKKEENIVQNRPTLLPKTQKATVSPILTANTSKTTVGGNISSSKPSGPYAAPPPAKPVIVNPYAKYKKKKQSTASSLSSTNHSTTVNSSRKNHSHPANPIASPIVKASINPNAKTFSQAFHAVETTSTNQTGGESNQDLEQQRALDASMLISQLQYDADKNQESNQNSARDNHALLQPHILHVSTRQRGNRILQHIRNVPFELSKMVPDYIMGSNRCALFLSCKYHKLHPTYIHRRIAELGKDFELRILLTLVDMDDNASTLLFLNHLAVLNNMTLILSWSEEEAARYLETFKAFEKKDASLIQKREKETHSEQIADVLASIRSINKTDSHQLLSQFGSLEKLIFAPMDELSMCPGIGPKKVKRLFDAFQKPFSSAAVAKKQRLLLEKDNASDTVEKKLNDEIEQSKAENTLESDVQLI